MQKRILALFVTLAALFVSLVMAGPAQADVGSNYVFVTSTGRYTAGDWNGAETFPTHAIVVNWDEHTYTNERTTDYWKAEVSTQCKAGSGYAWERVRVQIILNGDSDHPMDDYSFYDDSGTNAIHDNPMPGGSGVSGFNTPIHQHPFNELTFKVWTPDWYDSGSNQPRCEFWLKLYNHS